jgi:hypothetical protein
MVQELYCELIRTPERLRRDEVWMDAAKAAADMAKQFAERHVALGGLVLCYF